MRYVKYIGPSHRRGITALEWRTIGVDAETVFWGPENGFCIPADQFTDKQMKKAIEPDEFLIVIGQDEQPEALPDSMTGEQADGPRIDMMGAVDPETGSAALSEASGAPSRVDDGITEVAPSKRDRRA